MASGGTFFKKYTLTGDEGKGTLVLVAWLRVGCQC